MKKFKLFLIIFSMLLVQDAIHAQDYEYISEPLKAYYGYLVVHTAVFEEYDDVSDVTRKKYKSYEIYNESGELYKNVSSSYFNPVKIKLAEGSYIIHAEIEYGRIYYFKIDIEAGKQLEIDKAMIEFIVSKE
jgi:hypothetical protein